jgi:hypothetical protein
VTKPNVASRDQVAPNNTDVGGLDITGSGLVSTADNSLREILSHVAKFYADLGGVNAVAGTADVITVRTASRFTALSTGLVLAFRAGANTTTDVTINVDGLGAKHIHKITGGEVALGGQATSSQVVSTCCRLCFLHSGLPSVGSWSVSGGVAEPLAH